MMSDGDRMPNAAKAIELGLAGNPVSKGTCCLGVLVLDVTEASESDVVSLPSTEVVGVNGGVAGVTTFGSAVEEPLPLGRRLDRDPDR
jgi:hypothetical protein